MHLAIDGFGSDPARFEDKELLFNFLDTYPSKLGMTKITEPKVLTYVGKVPEDWGLSGFVIIAESHISVHTFPARNYINVDVFSCKPFNTDKALEDVKRVFGLKSVNIWKMPRGLEVFADEPQHSRKA
jgi:S-adenosylmethionine decarboxylase